MYNSIKGGAPKPPLLPTSSTGVPFPACFHLGLAKVHGGVFCRFLRGPELQALQLSVRLPPGLDNLVQERHDLVGFVLADPASVPDAKCLEDRAERGCVRRRRHSA